MNKSAKNNISTVINDDNSVNAKDTSLSNKTTSTKSILVNKLLNKPEHKGREDRPLMRASFLAIKDEEGMNKKSSRLTTRRATSPEININPDWKSNKRLSSHRSSITFEDYVNRRSSTSALEIDIPNVCLDHCSSSILDEEKETGKRNTKCLRFMKSFFIDNWIPKLVCCVPIGILGASILRNVYGGGLLIILYVVLFCVFVAYPLVCSIEAIYKLLLPFYQLWRYSPRSGQDSESPKEKDGKQKKNSLAKCDEKVLAENFAACIDKRLLQIKSESRRPSCRRASTLPPICEKEADEGERENEDDEDEDDKQEKEDRNGKSPINIGTHIIT